MIKKMIKSGPGFVLENLVIRAWGMHRYPVRLARTQEEKEAVYSFRYKVYCSELNQVSHPDADHKRLWLYSPEDDSLDSHIFYLGSPDNILGTVRCRLFLPGTLPDDVYKHFSLERIPQINSLTICLTQQFMLDPTIRGGLPAVSMLMGASKIVCEEHPVDLTFSDNHPRMVTKFSSLGFRPYGGRFISRSCGLSVPMLAIPSDINTLFKRRSPITLWALELYLQNLLPKKNLSRQSDVCVQQASVQLDRSNIIMELRESSISIFSSLQSKDFEYLAKLGMIIEVESEVKIIGQGLIETELYVILKGSCHILQNKNKIGCIEHGCFFGEETFFHTEKQHSTEVRAAETTRLFVLFGSAFSRLEKKNPAVSQRIYRLLSRMLAEQVTTMTLQQDISALSIC